MHLRFFKFLLLLLLAIALFVRTYRISSLLGFYYDQGRDALAIWDLWHSKNFFLIGPTTGIEGIFLGPFYYYLIAPSYILGQGNPIYPAIFLAVINVAGIYVIYRIGKDYFSKTIGLLAALFITLSYQLVLAHRWLSNPTPLPLFSALSVWLLLKIVHQSKTGYHWLLLGLSLGLSLQLEAASAIFFLPATAIILIVFRKSVAWDMRRLIHFIFAFSFTLIPQLLFNYRNANILFTAFRRFLIEEKSFQPTLVDFLSARVATLFSYFVHKFTYTDTYAAIFFLTILCLFLGTPKTLPKKPFSLILIWCLTPVFLLMFYRGNHGFVWDYYFTGVYSLIPLLVASIFITAYQHLRFARPLVVLMLVFFLWQNVPPLFHYLTDSLDKSDSIALGPSLKAVRWTYENAVPDPFNVDVYVPPVIPYSYAYLFLWQGTVRYHRQPHPTRQPVLYTLYEADPPHPERLSVWLDRQAGIAKPESGVRFGGVTVERRLRIN